jgi:hypothetical protein
VDRRRHNRWGVLHGKLAKVEQKCVFSEVRGITLSLSEQ